MEQQVKVMATDRVTMLLVSAMVMEKAEEMVWVRVQGKDWVMMTLASAKAQALCQKDTRLHQSIQQGSTHTSSLAYPPRH
jgi:hypothetical protein